MFAPEWAPFYGVSVAALCFFVTAPEKQGLLESRLKSALVIPSRSRLVCMYLGMVLRIDSTWGVRGT